MDIDRDIPGIVADLQTLAPAGFAIGLHVRLATPTFMFQTYPKAWLEEYAREGMIARDPTVVWGFSNTGHVLWRDLAPQDVGGVLARAAEKGLLHGLTVSLVSGNSRSLGSFSRGDRDFTTEEVARIEAGMAQLHDETASARSLPEDARESLRRLSVAFTHP